MTYYMDDLSGHVHTQEEWEVMIKECFEDGVEDIFVRNVDGENQRYTPTFEEYSEDFWDHLIQVSWNSDSQAWEE